jgi:protoheme IX farnesyltransferase
MKADYKIKRLMKSKLNMLLELTKIRITSFVALTTAFGFISAAGEINSKIILPLVGILLLACGSAVINHYQERKTDAMMDRTKYRPIPSRKISSANALKIALAFLFAGSVILLIGAGWLGLGLGLLNLLWYNGIYTPLKRVNAMAIIPGSLVGAIPPAVGWVAAGAYIFDPQIIVISFFFFIWQIPHFWLLLLIFGNDYKKAGFPTLTEIFNPDQLARITFIWITATAVTSLLIPFFGVVKYHAVEYFLFAAGIWLTWNSFKLLKTSGRLPFGFAFKEINIFALLVVIILSLDKIISV